jgi:hypothetical protein
VLLVSVRWNWSHPDGNHARSQGPFLKPETSHTAVQQEKHQCPFKKQPSFFCFSAKRFQGVWKKAQNGTRNLID